MTCEWLVELTLKDDRSIRVVKVVEAVSAWEAHMLALESKNMPTNWRVTASERA